jgi:hypothetical protein
MGSHTVTEEGFSPRSHLCPLLLDSRSPHACSTPGVYTFTVTKTVLRMLTSLALGFSNRPDRKSQSSVVATGLLPGVFTSSTHSLTWREFLTGLTTCSLTNSNTVRMTTRLNQVQTAASSHIQSRTAWPLHPIGKNSYGHPKTETVSAKA